MGYYVTLTSVDFTIPADKIERATKIVRELNANTPDEHKRGGNSTERWFSWLNDIDWETITVDQVLDRLGFECGLDDEGDLVISGYDSKTGQEDWFIAALAPLVKAGSYMEWRGEDGDQYRWYVDSTGVCMAQQPVVTWAGGHPLKEVAQAEAEELAAFVSALSPAKASS